MMLEIKDICKSFGKEVLKGISLNVNKGDVICIIGPSGSGKTTFLRCINFLEKADKGTIVFDGVNYNLENVTAREIMQYRKKTGFVFQNYNLFLNKKVLENVTEGLVTGRKISKEEAVNKAKEVLKKVGMDEYEESYPNQLSGGQAQRVAIARAMALEPEIIFFDEPTSALDPNLTGEVLSVMRDLAMEGTTMIVVTHELSFAKNVSNRMVFIKDGIVVEENNTAEFFNNPQEEETKKFIKTLE